MGMTQSLRNTATSSFSKSSSMNFETTDAHLSKTEKLCLVKFSLVPRRSVIGNYRAPGNKAKYNYTLIMAKRDSVIVNTSSAVHPC